LLVQLVQVLIQFGEAGELNDSGDCDTPISEVNVGFLVEDNPQHYSLQRDKGVRDDAG
jgi:hypothetical protein